MQMDLGIIHTELKFENYFKLTKQIIHKNYHKLAFLEKFGKNTQNVHTLIAIRTATYTCTYVCICMCMHQCKM